MADPGPWRILVTARAERDLKALQPSDQARVRAAIDRLALGPREARLKKLQGTDNELRLRVGDWRVRLELDPRTATVLIHSVRHRREAYR